MKNKELEALRQKAAPLAQQFLDDPEMMERLKKMSPGLSEEYLKMMLKMTVENEE